MFKRGRKKSRSGDGSGWEQMVQTVPGSGSGSTNAVAPYSRPGGHMTKTVSPSTYFSTSPVRFLTPPNKNEKKEPSPPFHASPRLDGCKTLSSSPAEWLSLSTKAGIGAICARKQREVLPRACPTVEPPGRTLLFFLVPLLDPKFLLSS